jgi:hypothetical protein
LTLTYNRILYVLEDTLEHRRLLGYHVTVHEDAPGAITIRHAGRVVPHRAHPKDRARITQGAIVDHKRLGAALRWITDRQRRRPPDLNEPKADPSTEQRIRMAAGLPGLTPQAHQDISTLEKTGHF